jgi:hypothetical protein
MPLHWFFLFLMVAPFARRDLAAAIVRGDLEEFASSFVGGAAPLAPSDSLWAHTELLFFEGAAHRCAPRLAALLPRHDRPPVCVSEVVARIAALRRVFAVQRETRRPSNAPGSRLQADSPPRPGARAVPPTSAFSPRAPPAPDDPSFTAALNNTRTRSPSAAGAPPTTAASRARARAPAQL